MWIVRVYKDTPYNLTNYSKVFKYEDDALEYFDDEIREEFNHEIREGLVSDQELTNIVDSGFYFFSNEDKEIQISLELDLSDEEDSIQD